jgi:hypothetical protein
MTIAVNKLYDEFFSGTAPKSWEGFRSNPSELLAPKEIDFSVFDKGESSVKKIALVALKIIFLPWGIYCGVKWAVQRLVMVMVYPVQSSLVKFFLPRMWKPTDPEKRLFTDLLNTKGLGEHRAKMADSLSKDGFVVRHVCLDKNGTKLSGLLVTHPEHSQNGKWALQACGNFQQIEHSLDKIARYYHKEKFNLLLVNNPGVGLSQGTATPDTMGEAQQTGISFLETAVKAKTIALGGYSLGGGTLGQAILKHNFKLDKVKYVVVRQMTFDRVSSVCLHRYRELIDRNWFKEIVRPLVQWAGCEMDSVEASRKLEDLGIPEVIIQRVDEESEFEDDGAIPAHATLGHGLHLAGVIGKTKKFIKIPNIAHLDGDLISATTMAAIHEWEFPPQPIVELQPSLGSRIVTFLKNLYRE